MSSSTKPQGINSYWYGYNYWFDQFIPYHYNVPGAKKELLRRIADMSDIEKLLLGMEVKCDKVKKAKKDPQYWQGKFFDTNKR